MIRALFALALSALLSLAAGAETAKAPAPGEALRLLQEGNKRYARHKLAHPDQSRKRMIEVARGQHPFAVVLGCSDSRVPPEIVFDQGLGDLFVIRVAGESLDDEVLGSIEYAAEHLGVTLVVVLGHEDCGAVKAAAAGGEAHGHIPALLKPIRSAVEEARRQPGDLVHNAIGIHVRHIVGELRHSEPILKELVEAGKLRVVGADYDVATGKVDFLADPLP